VRHTGALQSPACQKRRRDIETIPLPERRAKAMERGFHEHALAKAPGQNDMRGKMSENPSKNSR
jgi:hypothetical protein